MPTDFLKVTFEDGGLKGGAEATHWDDAQCDTAVVDATSVVTPGGTCWTDPPSNQVPSLPHRIHTGTRVARSRNLDPNGTGNQHAKFLKFADYLDGTNGWTVLNRPWGSQTGAWFSGRYNIQSGFDSPVEQNCFQWKTDDGKSAEMPNIVPPDYKRGHRKLIGGFFTPTDGVTPAYMQIQCIVNESNLAVGDIPTYQVPGSTSTFRKLSGPTQLFYDTWFHLEIYLIGGDPSRVGNQDAATAGRWVVFIDGNLEMDISHPDLNTLTSNRPGKVGPSDNRNMYYLTGAYVQPVNYVAVHGTTNNHYFYMDQNMITDHSVSGATLPGLEQPRPPLGGSAIIMPGSGIIIG